MCVCACFLTKLCVSYHEVSDDLQHPSDPSFSHSCTDFILLARYLFRFTHNLAPMLRTLSITVVEGKELIKSDLMGKSDPYTIITVTTSSTLSYATLELMHGTRRKQGWSKVIERSTEWKHSQHRNPLSSVVLSFWGALWHSSSRSFGLLKKLLTFYFLL